MEDESVWGPRIDRPEGGWPDGKCPIQWAKAGEYLIYISASGWLPPAAFNATGWNWGNLDDPSYDITAYRVRADKHRVQSAEPDVVERMAAFVLEIRRISDDYHPDRPQDAELALAEMREALQAALAAYEASKQGAGR